ncbi:MAG: pyridoxal-phosphate dependent enzyme [Pseudomonadota bacterium]
MEILINTHRRMGLDHPQLQDIPWTAQDASLPEELFERIMPKGRTPLVDAEALARDLGLGALHIKDERGRMGLGSFKALGAAYVIAHDAAEGRAEGRTYIAASAGNHGISVAAGARKFGAQARIFLAETVPESFADRLRGHGADVVWAGAVYEESMAAAADTAEREGHALLSDSSWPGYTERPHRLMEGYLALMSEAISQIPRPATHVFLQAGVGGLAGACAAYVRRVWGDAPQVVVVEPEVAPALQASILAGGPVIAPGPVSAMGRLDCKEPSLIALKSLARDADVFLTISEEEGAAGAAVAEKIGLPSTPSGAGGLAGLLAAAGALNMGADARALVVLSEESDTA